MENIPIRSIKDVESEMKLKNLLLKNKIDGKPLFNIFIRKYIARDGDCGAHCLRSIIKDVRGAKIPLEEIKDMIFEEVQNDRKCYTYKYICLIAMLIPMLEMA